MEQRGHFDAAAFFAALDGQRRGRGLNWKQVADESQVSASTLTRMGQGRRPDVDSLAALCQWGGLDANDYIAGQQRGEAEPLAMISTYLRSDPNLTPEGANALEAVIQATYERLRQPGGAS